MRPMGLSILGRIALLMLLPAVLFSANYRVIDGPKDFYYGHISFSEIRHDGKDPLVFRDGQKAPETAELNFPIGPGDTIRTSDCRRCEVQFDNGTIVRLDHDTELLVGTVLAQSLSSMKRISNLVLNKGRVYVMYKKYDSSELFQVLTPNTAVKLGHHGVAVLETASDGSSSIQVERGDARLLFGRNEDQLQEKKVKKLERWVVSREHNAQPSAFIPSDDFLEWNRIINENFSELHDASFLPKPVQRLPKAVMYFAQKYGNLYGEWVWHDLYGYVWRPHYNDYYPWGNWRPYYYGRWTALNNQLFWVPEEPWGWVPYHLGIWVWDKNRGWLWMPGSLFAPAWVSWDYYMGWFAWSPWSLMNWSGLYFDGSGRVLAYSYAGTGRGRDFPFDAPSREPLTTIRKDQLKKKDANSLLPMPKEMKEAFTATVQALKKGDERVLESYQGLLRAATVVKKEDLASERLAEKALTLDHFFRHLESLFPDRNAMPQYQIEPPDRLAMRHFRPIPDKRAEVAQPEPFSPSAGPAPAGKVKSELLFNGGMRLRDWNPDVKVAQGLGVDIIYSSRDNMIRCPQLNLSSDMVVIRRPAFGESGGFQGSASANSGSADTGSSSGAGHSSGHSSAGGQSSGAPAGAGTKGEKK